MARRSTSLIVCGCSAALLLAVSVPTNLHAAKKADKPDKKVIQNPQYDASAEQVDLFDAADAGQVSIKLVPKDANGGKVFIENKTNKPLTVKVPEAVVGISVHAQIMGLGQGNLFGGPNNGGQGLGQNNNQTGGQQLMGGILGMNAQGQQPQGQGPQFPGNNNGFNQPGGNFFSIPAERTISLTMSSVCLEHGKPEPTSGSKYTLVRYSKVSDDQVLYQALASLKAEKADVKAVQAVAWHLANKMTFEELSTKTEDQLGGLLNNPYFTSKQLTTAKRVLEAATERAKEATAEKTDKTSIPVSANTKTIRVATN